MIYQTLELFTRQLQGLLGSRLVSVILHGSILFDDLAPGYSDIDVIVIVEDALTEDESAHLDELRVTSGECAPFGCILEGEFIPKVLCDPQQAGQVYCWGTHRTYSYTGRRRQDFSWQLLLERGIVIFGEDLRAAMPAVPTTVLLDDIRATCAAMREFGSRPSPKAIEWLFLAARALVWLHERRICSKSEAADWAQQHAQGEWKQQLETANWLRQHFSVAKTPVMQAWLRSLPHPIQAACEEVEQVLASRCSGE